MSRVVILLALISACRASAPPATPADPVIAKKVAVSWGIEKVTQDNEAMADVFLATTDETGKQISRSLGRYKGACEVIVPAPEMNAVTGVACRTGGGGTELHAVVQRGTDIVVVKLGVTAGVAPDPMAREEVARVQVPPGAKIEVAP